MKAANGLDGDLHEFRITPAGTALLSVYEAIQVDLSSVGKGTGPIWDCLIQEIDLETGLALFQWRASEHYDVTDSYRGVSGDGEGDRAWDFFHMNSVDKDAAGNYLVSARYTRSLTYINGTTGDVIWILGGKKNKFKDLSGGRATDFAYQHDARWDAEGATLTVFDNAVDNENPLRGDSRGLRLKVDQQAMTVSVVTEYINPRKLRAITQGSLQTLPGGNVLLSYGHLAAFSEFSHDGRLLCDVNYAPESRFGTGDVQAYRVYKFAWQGWPLTKPDTLVALDEHEMARLFVSWNGATEVVTWDLEGAATATASEEEWVRLDTLEKTSFESAFRLRHIYPRFLRASGRDGKGGLLGTSEPVEVAIEVLDQDGGDGSEGGEGDAQAYGSQGEDTDSSQSQVSGTFSFFFFRSSCLLTEWKARFGGSSSTCIYPALFLASARGGCRYVWTVLAVSVLLWTLDADQGVAMCSRSSSVIEYTSHSFVWSSWRVVVWIQDL